MVDRIWIRPPVCTENFHIVIYKFKEGIHICAWRLVSGFNYFYFFFSNFIVYSILFIRDLKLIFRLQDFWAKVGSGIRVTVAKSWNRIRMILIRIRSTDIDQVARPQCFGSAWDPDPALKKRTKMLSNHNIILLFSDFYNNFTF